MPRFTGSIIAGFLLLVVLSSTALADSGPTRLHFVRHGETVANATGVYRSANLNVFSTRGEEQVRRLTRRLLAAPRFDVICVSPIPRAMKTIRPFLVESHSVAEIWPALAECCHQKDHTPVPDARLPLGGPIKISAADAPYFKLAGPDAARWYSPETYAEGLVQVRTLARQIRDRFGGTGKTVLLVGHGINGSLVLAALLGRELKTTIRLDNGEDTILEERPDGTWRLVQVNGRPVAKRAPAPVAEPAAGAN